MTHTARAAFLLLSVTFAIAGTARAASTCAGFIPAAITTPANLVTAINAAQSASCPGADQIDLAGNTITFTAAGFTDIGEALALPPVTTPISIINGTITRSAAGGFRLLAVTDGGVVVLDSMTVSNGGGAGIANGGAVRVFDTGSLTVTHTTFLNNSAPGYGGGAILSIGSATLSISDSLFRGNSSGETGGAIVTQANTILSIRRSRFLGNTAPFAAAFEISSVGPAEVHDSLIAGNTGSAVELISGASPSFFNTTIAGNSGAGIAANSSVTSHVYRNMLIWGNGGPSFSGPAPTTLTSSAAQGYAGATINAGYTPHDFFVNPLIAPTAANTGANYNPTLYDWTLRPFSPAIDAGQNLYASTSDLDTLARRVDDPNVVDAGTGTAPIVDMGASERPLPSCGLFAYPYTVFGANNALRRLELRDAIHCANLNGAGADTIDLNGQFVSYDAALANATALPDIATDITLRNGLVQRDFTVAPEFRLVSVSFGGRLTLEAMTLRYGAAGANPGNVGGAIRNAGQLNVLRSSLVDNSAYAGGAIQTQSGAVTTISRSTLFGNVAVTRGAALDNLGIATVSDSTIAGQGFGSAAIDNATGATLTLLNTTLAGNGIPGVISAGNLVLRNSILANNTGADCTSTSGPAIFSAGASNLIETSAANPCGAAGTQFLAVDPQLGGLTGSPAYFPIASAASPAANAGDNSVVVSAVDQPGNARVQQTRVDLGSVESPFAAQVVTLQFFAPTSVFAEAMGFGNLLRVVTSDGAPTAATATVTVDVVGGSASNADFNRTGTITVPAGTGDGALVSIASGITVINETLVEPHETIQLSLSAPVGASLGAGTTILHTINNDDSATVTVADAGQAEGNAGISPMTFTVTLDNPVQGGLSLVYGSTNLSATTADADYIAASDVLTFSGTAGETQTFAATINGDTKLEPNETFQVYFQFAAASVAPGALIITDTAVGTIVNDDAAALTIADVSQAENGTFTFSATLGNATASPFSVDWALAAGTTSAADYVGGVLPTGGTLNFSGAAGELQTLTIPVLDDALVESSEAFAISLANFVTSGGFVVTTSDTATGTIADNDTAALTIADVSIAEGNAGSTLATFTATLTNAVSGGLTVNYATANGTATTAGLDYASATGTLFFAGTAGELQVFSVTINGDTAVEPDETFSVSMNTVSNPAVTITDTAIGTIVNDDVAGYVVDTSLTGDIAEPGGSTSFTVRLLGAPSGTVILDVGSTDLTECTASPAGFTFTPGNWNVAQTVTISAVDDLIVDGAQPCAATLARSGGTAGEYASVPNPPNVTVNVADNDAAGITVAPTTLSLDESGGTATFAIGANTAPMGSVSVPLSTDGQCEVDVGGGFGTSEMLTLPAGSTVAQTITVRAVNDPVIEGAHTCAIATGNPSSAADAFYDALTAAAVADVTANVADNDVLHTVAAGAGGAEGTGTNPTFTFTVTRSGATNVASSVDYALGGTGVAGTDYVVLNPATDITGTGITASAGTIGFAANATVATLTVTANADSIDEADFSIALSLFTPIADAGAGTGTLAGSPASLTITDDDVAGYLVDTTATAASISEASGATTFGIRLATQPAGTVIMDFNSTDPSECTVSPASFTFNAGNWNIVQTITITAVDDAVVDGAQPCSVTVTRSGGTAPEFTTVANPAAVGFSVTDDDVPGVDVAPTAITASEGGAGGSYSLVLNSQPSGVVTITVGNDAQIAATPSTLQFTTANWNVPQTVTVAAVDDAVAEGTHVSTITHGASGADYAGVAVTPVAVTITDNDAAGIVVAPTSGLVTTEAGAAAAFTVVLSSEPTAAVTIGVSSSDTSEGTVAPGTLGFDASNWNVAQTVTVTGVDDAVVDGSIAYGILTAAATSTDPNYAGIDAADVSLSNTDDDGASLAIADVSLAEGDVGSTAFVFTVSLSGDVVGGVTVAYATVDDTAAAPSDYTALSGTLVFAGTDGETRTVSVPVVGDGVFEGDERFRVVLSAPTPTAVVLARSEAFGTIQDDDAVALLSATKRVTQVGTAAQPVIYEIVLGNTGSGAQPDDPVSDELVDLLPAGLALQSATASAGTVVTSGNSARWNGALAAGASVTLQISAQVVATNAGPISNQAQIAYDSDGDGSNDASAVSDDPATTGADATVFTFAGAVSQALPPPTVIPTLDPRTLLWLVLCVGLLGAVVLRRQQH